MLLKMIQIAVCSVMARRPKGLRIAARNGDVSADLASAVDVCEVWLAVVDENTG
jgi:hypothetical protein